MISADIKPLKYDDLSSKLIAEFPELRRGYEDELEWWSPEKPGQHVVYGDIFTPFLIELLHRGEDRLRIERAFALIETLLSSQEVRVQEVAVVTVLEYLQSKPNLLRLAGPFWGPLASTATTDLAGFWDGNNQNSHQLR